MQRSLLHRRHLLPQFQYPILPISLRIEPRKRNRKRRIIPPPRDPRRIVDETQRAQRLDQIGRYEIMREQPVAWLATEACDVERRARVKWRNLSDGMDAPDEAAYPLQRARVVELRRATTAPGENREAQTIDMVQGRTMQTERRHDGYLALGQLARVSVLFLD